MLKVIGLYLALTVAALAQAPAVNSGTATYPSSGSIADIMSASTVTIVGGVLTAGSCASGTVAVANSTTTMTVQVTPNTYPGDGTLFFVYPQVESPVKEPCKRSHNTFSRFV